jgi:hypothetical protein
MRAPSRAPKRHERSTQDLTNRVVHRPEQIFRAKVAGVTAAVRKHLQGNVRPDDADVDDSQRSILPLPRRVLLEQQQRQRARSGRGKPDAAVKPAQPTLAAEIGRWERLDLDPEFVPEEVGPYACTGVHDAVALGIGDS